MSISPKLKYMHFNPSAKMLQPSRTENSTAEAHAATFTENKTMDLVDLFFPPALLRKYEKEQKKRKEYKKPVEAEYAVYVGVLGIILISVEIAFILLLDITSWLQRATFCIVGENCPLRRSNGVNVNNASRIPSQKVRQVYLAGEGACNTTDKHVEVGGKKV